MNRSMLVFAALAAALLVSLLLWFKPAAVSPPVESVTDAAIAAQPAPEPQRPQVSEPAVQQIQLTLEHGHLTDGPDTIRVEQGTALRLTLVSDAPGEWHLHGYDLHAELSAGAPTTVDFIAEHSGRFEHELHGTGQHAHGGLGVIEVYPGER